MHVLEAVAAVDEVVGLVFRSIKELRVTVLNVPCPRGAHQREQFNIKRQGVRPAADIKSVSNQIPA